MLYLGQKSKTPSENYNLESKSRGFIRRRKYTEVVYILGDSMSDTVDQVRAVAGLPTLYQEYDGCYCVDISPKEAATVVNPTTGVTCSLWEVTIAWDSDLGTDSEPGGDPSSAPDAKPPQYKWNVEIIEVPMEKDGLGNPVVLPTGEPVVLMKQKMIAVLTIQRNEKFPYEPSKVFTYANTLNNAAFWGAPTCHAWLLPPETDFPFAEGGIVYVPVTYTIKFKGFKGAVDPGTGITGLTWDSQDIWCSEKVLCKGLYHYDAGEYAAWVAAGSDPATRPKPRLNRDDDNNPIERALDPDDGTILPDQSSPEYISFASDLPYSNFDDLNLQPWWWVSTTTTT